MKRRITNEFVLTLRMLSVSKVQTIIKSLTRIKLMLERLSEIIFVKPHYSCVNKCIIKQYKQEKRMSFTTVVLYAESRRINRLRRY